MKTPKWPLVAALSLATVFMVACGEEKDSRISDADALCLKMLRAGGNCGGTAAGGAGSTTATVSTTVTNSTTVTVTQSNTSN